MGDDLRAALIIVVAIWRSKLTHRKQLIANLLVNSLDVFAPAAAMVALVHTFGTLSGWTLPEVMLLLGSASLCLGLSLLFAGAFDSFLFVPIFRSGQLESALLRPGSTILFIAASNMRPYRCGRVAAALFVTVFAVVQLDHHTWQVAAVLPVAVVIGTLMLSAMWFIDASAVIRLGQPNDMTRNIPFVAAEMSMYPHALYPPVGRFLAQFVLGLGSATYLPIAYALDKGPHLGVWSLVAGPAILPVVLFVSHFVWSRSIGSFESQGAT